MTTADFHDAGKVDDDIDALNILVIDGKRISIALKVKLG